MHSMRRQDGIPSGSGLVRSIGHVEVALEMVGRIVKAYPRRSASVTKGGTCQVNRLITFYGVGLAILVGCSQVARERLAAFFSRSRRKRRCPLPSMSPQQDLPRGLFLCWICRRRGSFRGISRLSPVNAAVVMTPLRGWRYDPGFSIRARDVTRATSARTWGTHRWPRESASPATTCTRARIWVY